MNTKNIDRVVFYSKDDLSSGHHLKKAENLLNNINLKGEFDINDLLEFYNVKLYFDNNLFLLSWNDSDKGIFKDIINKIWVNIQDFWFKINNENIIVYIENLEFRYNKSFWELINYFQVYNRIDKNIFTTVLNKFSIQITYILVLKNIVKHFDNEIKIFLIDYKKTAELLLSKIEEEHRFTAPNYYFPNSLTLLDKENIISKYLDYEHANVNYVRLIVKSKDSNELKLTPKVRLKAKKKSEELNNRILKEGHSWKVGVQVTFDKDQNEPLEFSNKDNILYVSYSQKFLDEIQNNNELFHQFNHLFLFINDKGIITLVSKENELDVLEKIFTKSKNEYLAGSVFQRKNRLSHLQIIIFNHYLHQRNNSIEEIVESFIGDFLNSKLNLKNLQLKFPTKNATFLEKIRVLAPEFEFLLKQFQAFVNEGEIDFELLELNSNPLRFSEIPSLVNKKYIYSKSDTIICLKNQFFSDQSMLYYVEPYDNKYNNLYDLLVNENIELNNFAHYQKDIINKLIEDSYLYIDSNNYIKIKNEIMILLIGELHKNEVICYWHYSKIVRNVIDEMIDKDLLYFENTLFTKQELNFFNFYLNKKEFTNGLDLRNKYLHGTNASSEDEHENEYYILLKLIILALLKIENDLMINNEKYKINCC